MHKPNVAFLIYSLGTGGAERVVSSLANELSASYNVFIFTLVDGESFYYVSDEVRIISCSHTVNESRNIASTITNYYKLLRKILSLLNKFEIVLILGFLTTSNILATIAAKINKIPVIISERNNPYSQKITILSLILRFLIYPMANFVVVQTTTIKKYYTNRILKRKLIIIPNAISKELAKERKLNSFKKNIILSVGSLTEQKNQETIIRAFHLVNNKDWNLYIVGEGEKREYLENLIEQLKLGDKIHLPGNTASIEKYYNISKIFVFSSLYEGFPNALLEAMHFGLACISTDCPSGPSELIKSNHNGFLVPPRNEQLFAKKLQILMSNPTKCNEFGTRAIEAIKFYDTDSIVNKWTEVMEECIHFTKK